MRPPSLIALLLACCGPAALAEPVDPYFTDPALAPYPPGCITLSARQVDLYGDNVVQFWSGKLSLEVVHYTWNLGFARAYAWVGDVERTIHYVEEIRAESPDGFLGDASDPMFDRIKGDPRWQAMLATVRERQAAIEFNPRLPPEVLALD